MSRAVLVASSCKALPFSDRRTGVSLHQLGSVHAAFTRAGWDLLVASPSGGAAPVDAGSLSEEWVSSSNLASGTVRLDELKDEDADAWFVLGGHGALCDLVDDATLLRVLASAIVSDRLVGAVDHGCAVLSALSKLDGTPLLAGRAVTGRTDVEEREVRHHELLPRTTERLLRDAGTRFKSRSPWHPFVVVDGNVVTGQNPASTTAAVNAVMDNFATVAFVA